MRELKESNNLIYQVINSIPEGPIQKKTYLMQPPSKTKIKVTIQSLIYHFCFFSNKLKLNLGEIYLGVEAPKGEFGLFLVSNGNIIPYRCKIRSPGFFHLKCINCAPFKLL